MHLASHLLVTTSLASTSRPSWKSIRAGWDAWNGPAIGRQNWSCGKPGCVGASSASRPPRVARRAPTCITASWPAHRIAPLQRSQGTTPCRIAHSCDVRRESRASAASRAGARGNSPTLVRSRDCGAQLCAMRPVHGWNAHGQPHALQSINPRLLGIAFATIPVCGATGQVQSGRLERWVRCAAWRVALHLRLSASRR